jgi:hypothetical protein
MIQRAKINSDVDCMYNDIVIFKTRVLEEIKRARRYASFVSLISVDFSHIDSVGEIEKFTNFEDFMASMRKFVRRSVRETDLISSTSQHRILILLVETPIEGAMVVSGRLKKTLRYFLCDNIKSPLNWRVPIKEYNFPAAQADNDNLLSALNDIDTK